MASLRSNVPLIERSSVGILSPTAWILDSKLFLDEFR